MAGGAGKLTSADAIVEHDDVSVSWATASVVFCAQLMVSFALYRFSLGIGFLSDAWVYLAHVRHGFLESIAVAIGYHYQPVAVGWIAAIRMAFGENPAAFQAVNVAQLAALGYLTYALGRRLLPLPGVAFIGSLLVIGSNAFYEATYWPLPGNCHVLSGQLFVLSVIIAVDVARSRLGASGPWLLGLAVLTAVLTHPAMVTAVPVCGLVLVVARNRAGESPRQRLFNAIKDAMPMAGVIVLVVIVRLVFSAAIATGPAAEFSWIRAYWLVTRGIVAVFSLRGSHGVAHNLMMFETVNGGPETTWVRGFVLGWIVVAGLSAILCWRYATTRGLRVLILMFAVHAVILTVAGGMAARQAHVLAVPAALLTAWGLHAAAMRLAKIIGTAEARAICAHLPAVGVLMLISWAVPDHVTAAKVYLEASQVSRALFVQIRAASPSQLVLVNLPGLVVERNIGAWAFLNGLPELARTAAPGVTSVQVVSVDVPGAPLLKAGISRPVSIETLRAMTLDPSQVVVMFAPPSTLIRLTPDILARLASQ